MNSLKLIDVVYIKQDKTIETILVSNSDKENIIFLYNYQGWFFRVFKSVLDLMLFFDEQFESKVCFDNEIELDNYLLNFKLT